MSGMTTEELRAHMEARIADIRKEDADQRHEKNKAVDKAIDALSLRLLEVVEEAKQSKLRCEASFTQTRNTLDALLLVMRGDHSMGQKGLVETLQTGMEEIKGRVQQVERISDEHRKAVDESRTHRVQHADIPQRVASIEQIIRDIKTQIRTIGWILGLIWPAICAFLTWLWNKAAS